MPSHYPNVPMWQPGRVAHACAVVLSIICVACVWGRV